MSPTPAPTLAAINGRLEEVLLDTTRLLIMADSGKRSVNVAWLKARLASDPVLFPPTRKVCAVIRQRLVDLQRLNLQKMQALWDEYAHSINCQRQRLLLDLAYNDDRVDKQEAEMLAGYLQRVYGRLRRKNPLIGSRWILACGEFLEEVRRCFRQPPCGRFERDDIRSLVRRATQLSKLSDLA